jgi:hypothetical protein
MASQFFRERINWKAADLLGEAVKAIVHWEIGGVPGYARPVDLWRTIPFQFGHSVQLG